MKSNKKESIEISKSNRKYKFKPKKPSKDNIKDVQKLVELLQIHQVELEHQNQELRITQGELELSRNKYVNLFDFSPISYFTLDLNGIIQEVNLNAAKMLGIERNKLIGNDIITYILPDERGIFHSFIKTVFNSSVKQSIEITVINKYKRLFAVLLEGIQLQDSIESNQKCQIAVIDLTERKKAEESINRYSEELKKLNNTKDKLFSIIAHDLRNSLQVLLGSSRLLSTEIENLSQEEIIYLSRESNTTLNNLYKLLENLLFWSMLQRDMIKHNPKNLNLHFAANKIIESSKPVASNKNISISNNLDEKTCVYADDDMLQRIFQNLITNAIKFTNSGGHIIISSISKNDFIEVSIKDTGIGIDPETSSKLFNMATMFSTKGTDEETGTGLGLPLCKEFVERNNGKIRVESEIGKGSKFIFTLPKGNSLYWFSVKWNFGLVK
jgi:PAS domain S-box-containing protein